MNRSSSSAEQQGDANWAAGNWDHPACVGLELKQYAGSRLEWDWQNAMLLSHHPIRGSNGDDQDRKFQITTGPLGSGPRTYNGIIPTALPSNYLQHPGSMLSPEAICTFSGISSASNFHPSLHGALVANSNFSGTASSGGHGTLRPFTFDQRRHLTGVVSIDDQKRELNDVVKREAEFYAGDAHARIGLNLGVRTYFSTDDTASGRLVKRPRVNSAGAQVPLCQAEGCKADLTNAKHYHRRHKVCELHSKAATVIAHGQTQRFCQQCSRFHILSEFDDGKRSCRKRLADHNRRRRKPPQANTVMGSTTTESLGFVKKADDDQFANCRSGHQTASVATSNGQALLSAIALSPSVSLMNAKRQLPAVTGSTQEALYQYLHGVGHNGTYLSLSSLGPAGRNPENQTQEQNASHNYNGMGPSLPWLRPASSSRSDNNDSATGSLHLQHFIPNKTNQNSETIAGDSANIPAFPSSFYNLMPTESCRDISNSDWLVDRGQSAQFRINMAGSLEGHQALSRLEASTSVRNFRSGSSGQRAVLEFLQPQPTFSGTDGDDSQSGSGHQSDMKFSDLQALTPLGASMYDSNQNIL